MNFISMQHSKTRTPDRLGKLATLPVFFKLSGRNILIAGGTEAAAWKAELMAATGAIVYIYSENICLQFWEIISANPDRYMVFEMNWRAAQFTDFALIIGDMEDGKKAQRFYDRAIASGVPVNVIDKPKFCQFQFGSIVNRSPTIVAISTDGAAPILGQAIRRKIEALLPTQLSGWTQFAQQIRASVADRLEHRSDKRKFWERFVNRAFQGGKNAPNLKILNADLEAIEQDENLMRGRISFVGAGFGDPEHLTLAAMRGLQAAEIVFFDDAIRDDVLSLARREARHICIGKAGLTIGQARQLMRKFALQGKNVVYIKLGNPLDDIDNVTFKKWFESHGIETLIVPGLSLTKPTKTFVGNIPDESFPGQQLSVPARGSSIHTSVPFEQ